MTEQPHRPRPQLQIPVRSLIGIILLVLGISLWIVLVVLGFQLQEMVGKNLRLIMELADSAGAGHP